MSFNFSFRPVENKKDKDRLVKFISSYPLDYKKYFHWLEKAVEELYLDEKQAALALSEHYLIGSLVHQYHKSLEKVREIKNIRTLNEFRHRFISSFLLRQVEVEAKKQGDLAMICDTRADRIDIINFLFFNGYYKVTSVDLYKEGKEDIVFMKPLQDRIKIDF